MFFYTANKDDIRKCPNEGWDYAGIIELKSCSDPLIWKKWNYQWVDPTQKGINGGGILNLFKPGGDKEILSYMWAVIFGKTCPVCQVTIYKDFGCSVMQWGYWKSEFCWMWMSKTESHGEHTGFSICPFGYFITHVLWIYFVFWGVNIHLYYRYESIRGVENSIVHFIMLTILSIFFLSSFNILLFNTFSSFMVGRFWEFTVLVFISSSILGVLGLWAHLTQFGYTLYIIWGILEVMGLLITWAILIIYYYNRPKLAYQQFVDEDHMNFDDNPDKANNFNEDLDILRENSVIQEQVLSEILGKMNVVIQIDRANMDPKKRKRRKSAKAGKIIK